MTKAETGFDAIRSAARLASQPRDRRRDGDAGEGRQAGGQYGPGAKPADPPKAGEVPSVFTSRSGLTRERVRRIESEAIGKLSESMQADL